MNSLALDPQKTALILIDLQNALKARQLAPHTFSAVVANSVALGDKLRAAGGTVVYVRVDVGNMPKRTTDAPPRMPATLPPDAAELVPDCGIQPGDLTITKHSWGAFLNTGLDQQLRAKGITTVLMAGVATNMGVESTARSAMDLVYDVVFVEDAMSTLSAEWHDFAVKNIFPNMGRVRTTAQLLEALTQ